jgi:hypothetical protein
MLIIKLKKLSDEHQMNSTSKWILNCILWQISAKFDLNSKLFVFMKKCRYLLLAHFFIEFWGARTIKPIALVITSKLYFGTKFAISKPV